MGYSLCIVALFGNFQNALFFIISCFFEAFFAKNNFNVLVETFFQVYREFYFLIQT